MHINANANAWNGLGQTVSQIRHRINFRLEGEITSPQPLLSILRIRVVVPGKALPAAPNRNCHGNENVCGPAHKHTLT